MRYYVENQSDQKRNGGNKEREKLEEEEQRLERQRQREREEKEQLERDCQKEKEERETMEKKKCEKEEMRATFEEEFQDNHGVNKYVCTYICFTEQVNREYEKTAEKLNNIIYFNVLKERKVRTVQKKKCYAQIVKKIHIKNREIAIL